MAPHGRSDVDARKCDAEPFADDLRVAAGTRRCAEARHCHRVHIGARTAEQLHCPHADKQRKRRIQPARDADDRCFRPGMIDALFQPMGLHLQNAGAALVAARPFWGYGRQCRNRPRQLCFGERHGKRDCQKRLRIPGRESGQSAALKRQALHIELADRHRLFKPACLRKHRAVFRDHAVSRKHKIGRRFTLARIRIQISAHKPS